MNKMSFISVAVIGLMFVIYMRSSAINNDKEKMEEAIAGVNLAVSEIDFGVNYPDAPESVVEANSEIMFLLYGGYIKEEDIVVAFEKQRMLYAREWLELNPFDEKCRLLTADILKNRQEGKKILSYGVGKPRYDAVDESICVVDSLQRTNTRVNNQVKYYLIMEDGMWRILAWEAVPVENTEG